MSTAVNIEKTIVVAGVIVLVAAVLFTVRAISFKLLHKWANRTKTNLDNLIINTVKHPSVYLCIGLALYAGLETADLSKKYALYIEKTIHALIILSITVATANLLGRLFTTYVERSDVSVQSTGLLNTIVKLSIYLIGFIIILHNLGISIAPVITALGIGGLAIGLALKDTLENLFAGIHIMTEKSLRVGDFVRLETGQEGYIEDISWRTTRIRMLPNNMIIIPNSKLAQSIVVNYSLPEKRMSLLIPISVSYSSDPEKVEKILIEETEKATQEVSGLLADPKPFVRFIPGFGESSLDFTLVCHVAEFTDQFSVQHELRKRIFRRFRQEGIEIPFPQRVVWLRKE